MEHLAKLARAILNAEDLIQASMSSGLSSSAGKRSKSTDTSPTSEERSKHETSVSYQGELDLSQEPSVEYLN